MNQTKALCLWCERELTSSEVEKRRELCVSCYDVAVGTLTLSEEQLDNLPFGAIALSKEGVILAFNHEEEELSGIKKEDVIGRNFFTEIAPCADVQDFRGRFADFLMTGNLTMGFTFTYHFPSGSVTVKLAFLRVNQDSAYVLSKRAMA